MHWEGSTQSELQEAEVKSQGLRGGKSFFCFVFTERNLKEPFTISDLEKIA